MDISKAYNNKILNSIKQNINHILDYNMISKIYHKFPLINCISLEDNYKLSSYTRLISKKNLSHQQFINEIPDLIDFALKYEHNNIFIKDKINSLLMNKYFPKKWNDMLILYDLKFISFIFLQYFENECDTLIILISNDKKIKINIAYSKNDYNETKINLSKASTHASLEVEAVSRIKLGEVGVS